MQQGPGRMRPCFGLLKRVLHGNEHRSLRRVGKLMLSQRRVGLSTGVRSSRPPASPAAAAPGPLPALQDGGPGRGRLGTAWTAPADGDDAGHATL